ncbi:MAG: hypothetical protein ACTSU5_00200 [Promethearchaeota archaeon]
MDSMPFLIDVRKLREKREDVRHETDLELGAALFLAENFRAGPGKVCKSKKRAKVSAILKVGWPIWAAKIGGEDYIFVDGLKTLGQKILAGLKMTPESLKAQLESLSPTEFLEKLTSDYLSTTENLGREDYFEGLFGGEAMNGLRKFAAYIYEDYEFTVPLPSLVKQGTVETTTAFLKDYQATMEKLVGDAEMLITALEEKRDLTFKVVDEEISTIAREFDDRRKELESEVSATKGKIDEEERAALDDLKAMRDKEKQAILALIRERIVPFKETINLISNNWDDDKQKIDACTDDEQATQEVKRALSRLKQNSTEFGVAVDKLSQDLLGHLERFATVNGDFDKREADVRGEHEKRRVAEDEKLEQLERERKEQIGAQEYLKTQIGEVLAKVVANIQQFINRKDEKLRIVENFRVNCQIGKADPTFLTYLPFYYVELDDSGSTVKVVVPPTTLGESPQKKVSELSYSQKILPLEAADETFLAYNERFKSALELNPELNDLLGESVKSEQLNVILSPGLKQQALQGWEYLKGRNIGKPKELDKYGKTMKQNF